MRYDWSTVTHQILTVYEMAVESGHAPVGEDPSSVRGRLRRWRGDES
ncbi:hypothetical protein [Cellulomonas denverensis]